MALAIKEFTADGAVVTDEIVRCDEAVVVGGVTYYRGYLQATCNESVGDATQDTYGVWTATGKAGTRQTVLVAAMPGASGTVRIDTYRGWMWATASGTFYVRYLAHDPIRHHATALHLPILFALPTGTAVTLATIKLPVIAKFGRVAISAPGGAPSADVTLTLSNGTESQAVTLPASGAAVAVDLADVLKVTTAQTLTVATTDGKGAYDFVMALLDVQAGEEFNTETQRHRGKERIMATFDMRKMVEELTEKTMKNIADRADFPRTVCPPNGETILLTLPISREYISCLTCGRCYDHHGTPSFCQHLCWPVNPREIEKNQEKARNCRHYWPHAIPRCFEKSKD